MDAKFLPVQKKFLDGANMLFSTNKKGRLLQIHSKLIIRTFSKQAFFGI